MCRNHRCFKTCDRSRDCGSSNLVCVRDLCRLKDGCGGESINCFESGGDYGDGGLDDDEYRDEGLDKDEYGDGNLDNDEYEGLDNDEYEGFQNDDIDQPARQRRPQRPVFGSRPQRPGVGGWPQGQGIFGHRPPGQGPGGFGGRNQRPGFRSSKNFTGHNNVTILKNVRVKRQSQNSEYCEDRYVIHVFKNDYPITFSLFVRLNKYKQVIHAIIFLVHVFNNVNVQEFAQDLVQIALMEAVETIGVLPIMIVLIGKDVLEANVPEGEGQSLQALQDQNLHLFHLFLGLQDVVPLEGHFALQEF